MDKLADYIRSTKMVNGFIKICPFKAVIARSFVKTPFIRLLEGALSTLLRRLEAPAEALRSI